MMKQFQQDELKKYRIIAKYRNISSLIEQSKIKKYNKENMKDKTR